MQLFDLEHILRASKGISGENEFVLIGSQSILGYKLAALVRQEGGNRSIHE